MTITIFLFWLFVLLAEGFLIANILLPKQEKFLLAFSLALPISAFSNVLIVFLCTIFEVDLRFLSFAIAHLSTIAVLTVAYWKSPRRGIALISSKATVLTSKKGTLALRLVCALFITFQMIFSFAHSVVLPTYHIDSLTNWTMRSKVSFYDHAIAFDADESRGVAKPQYPFLFHSLQILVNEGNADWSDRSANAIVFLLNISSLISLFFLILRRKGFDIALISIASLLSIPLLSFHVAVQYGDIHLVTYLLLSCVTLWLWKAESERKWLILSALFVASSAWTKTEGLIVGTFLWLLMIAPELRIRLIRWDIISSGILVLLFSLPFSVFLVLHDMNLTPHSSDTTISWHTDAFFTAITGLFTGGSMGIVWFALPIATFVVLKLAKEKNSRIDASALRFGLWGYASLGIILFTYVCTPNAGFLASGESYYRQLMVPSSLLILWIAMMWKGTEPKAKAAEEVERAAW